MEDWQFYLLELYYNGEELFYNNLKKTYTKKYDHYGINEDEFFKSYNQIRGANYIQPVKYDPILGEVYKITQRGINKYNLEKQKRIKEKEREELNDLLLKSSIANTKIQSSLLVVNRWIALGGIAAALYYLLEIQIEVKKQYPHFYCLIFPYVLTALGAVAVTVLIWLFLKYARQK